MATSLNHRGNDNDSPQSEYIYHDYSTVPESSSSDNIQIANKSLCVIRSQKLPVKLDTILSDPEFSNIIVWMPHGRAWRILRPKRFTSEVIPKYFEYNNYNSFIRLVNAWGFRRITSGMDQGAYYHELFLRGMPHLHRRMRRLTSKDKKVTVDSENEPDFYKFNKYFPLPSSGSNSINELCTTETPLGHPSFSGTSHNNIALLQNVTRSNRNLAPAFPKTENVVNDSIAEKIVLLKNVNEELAKLDNHLENRLLLQRIRIHRLQLSNKQPQSFLHHIYGSSLSPEEVKNRAISLAVPPVPSTHDYLQSKSQLSFNKNNNF